ncbi:MAG TPA: M48 family metallopeptidase [Verrucomicrobiae bacterium]|nr:M48 family metallopeptidase [Verrucomicrobiae bacterium]
MTLYTQVSQNRYKTFAFLGIFMALVVGIGWAVSLYYGSPDILLIAGVIAVVQGTVSLYASDKIALAAAKADVLDEQQYRFVYQLVENLSITAGLPMPRLYFIDDTAINAFATGRDPKHAAIAVTRGAIERLDKNELEGVLAHELAHVGNEDIRLMSMVMVMAGIIALVSDLFLRSMFYGRQRDDNNNSGGGFMLIIALVFAILAPIAATLIQLAISRKREFMADATGVLLTRYPEGLISALQKIGGDTEPLEVANRGTAHMYFSNPLTGQALANMFATHPPIEARIAALQAGSGMTQA